MRTKQEIDQDYSKVCTELGDLQFKLESMLPIAIKERLNKLHSLVKESQECEKVKDEAATNKD